MKIEIFGTGCPKCQSTMEVVKQALKETGKEAEVVKVTDINQMIDRGIMQTPALMINNKLVAQGKSLGIEELKNIISREA